MFKLPAEKFVHSEKMWNDATVQHIIIYLRWGQTFILPISTVLVTLLLIINENPLLFIKEKKPNSKNRAIQLFTTPKNVLDICIL